jgi:hypothetical protein
MERVRKRHTNPDGDGIASRMHRHATRIFAGMHGYTTTRRPATTKRRGVAIKAF